MRVSDRLRFSLGALFGARVRTLLMLIAMAIGVAAVVMLTALGESARRYVTGEFASLGTHLLIVLPGRNETTGGPPPLLSETPRDLTLDDALALRRSPHVRLIAPLTIGSAPLSWKGKDREAVVMGTTAEMEAVRHLELAQGRFLPPGDPNRATAVCIIGAKLREELFGSTAALGQWVRIGDRRFRVIGVMAPQGQSLGTNTDETVMIPVAAAQALFDAPSLFRILVEASSREVIEDARGDILATLRDRHDGEEDVTVITQDAVLATFDRILRALTLAVGGIAAISLVVAGILIMNVMLVTVAQRRAEIGLLKALGAPPRHIQTLFLTEAALLSLVGALAGLLVGFTGALLIAGLYPALPLSVPVWALVAAVGVALAMGTLFGVLPARRAARLDPVQALARR